MSASFLHGTEVIEANSGARSIRTVRTGVIAVVGTADDSAPATTASVVIGQVATDVLPARTLTLRAVMEGANGNAISIEFVQPEGTDASPVDIQVNETTGTITYTYERAASGELVERVHEVGAALSANLDVSALATVEFDPDDSTPDSAWRLTNYPQSYSLAGGSDEPFPLNTPVAIPGVASRAAPLGDTGTLPAALDLIFSIATPIVVVVRVTETSPELGPLRDVLGDQAEGTGVWALLNAESITGFKPKILIAPGFTHVNADGEDAVSRRPVAAALSTIADRLRAFVYADCFASPPPGQPPSEIYEIGDLKRLRSFYGDRRMTLVHPQVKVFRNGMTQNAWLSTVAAAITALTDLEQGFSRSPSNIQIQAITGLAEPISFSLGDPNSMANLLNEGDISTVIRAEGFRMWGNRTTSSDSKFQFITVVRTNDAIAESVQRAHLYAVDNKISRNYIEAVVGGVRSYINQLRISEQIVNGDAWFDEELNPIERLRDGWVHISYDFAPYYPAERLTFVSSINDEYLREIFA